MIKVYFMVHVAHAMQIAEEGAWSVWPLSGGGECHQLCCSQGCQLALALATSGSCDLGLGAAWNQTQMPCTSAVSVRRAGYPQASEVCPLQL